MSFLPIAHRELISAARKPGTWIRRTLFFVAMLTIAAFVIVDTANRTPATQGEQLFSVIAGCLAFYAATIGIHATADAFGWEKREGTLGLLFLTDLSGADVVAGKLAAKATNAFYGLLSMIPLLALPLLLGGVRLERVVLTSVMLIATSIVSLSIGLWVSSRSTNERRAMMLTLGLLLVYLVGPIITAAMSEEIFGGRPEDSWRYGVASPLMGLLHVQIISMGGGGAPPWPRELWIYSLVLSLVLSAAAIVSAARHLPHSWSPELLEARKKRKRPATDSKGIPIQSPAPATISFKQKMDLWKRRYAIRQRPLLNIHPYIWLGERFADKRLMAAIVTVALLVLPIVFLSTRSTRLEFDFIVPFFYIASFLLLIWMVAEPIVRLNEDRHAGALELVLTTPMQGPEIIRGMQRSMLRIFLAAGILLAAAALALNQLSPPAENEEWWAWTPIIYLAACFGSLRWVGPWIGLSSKSVTAGMIRALVLMALPSIVWSGVMVLLDQWQRFLSLLAFQVPSEGDYRILWMILSLPLLAWLPVLFYCWKIFSRPRATFWKSVLSCGVAALMLIAALAMTFLVSFFWIGATTHVQLKTFLFLHTVGVMVIAYGWAKPQLETRFRDLATRPFEN